VLLTLVTFGALVAFGPTLTARGGGGVLALELGCVLLPTLLWLYLRRVPAAALGLDRVAWVATAGGLVAAIGAFYLMAALVEPWLDRLVPTPPEVRAAIERMLLPATGRRPLAIDLMLFALAPALAEELLFRGVLMGALQLRLGRAGAVAVAALAFAAYHASPSRFLPALLGGLLLGAVRVAAGALTPAIAFHAANNAAVVIAVRLGYATPPLRPAAVLVAAVAVVAGALLIARGARR
jgi:sodium transport system permease protein